MRMKHEFCEIKWMLRPPYVGQSHFSYYQQQVYRRDQPERPQDTHTHNRIQERRLYMSVTTREQFSRIIYLNFMKRTHNQAFFTLRCERRTPCGPVHSSLELDNPNDIKSSLEYTVVTMETKVIVRTNGYNNRHGGNLLKHCHNEKRGHCQNTLL